MSIKAPLYVNNDNQVDITGVVDQNGNPVVGATITATVLDAKGVAIPGATATLTDVAGSPGSYRGVISNLTVTLGSTNRLDGTLQFTALNGTIHFGANKAVIIAPKML